MSSTSRPFRIFYGGTFDPVHDGHLAVAQAAATVFDSDVFMVPSADPPHRAPPGASADQRATMLDLAITHCLRLHVDRRELLRATQGRASAAGSGPLSPSYSVDTLFDIRSEIGADTSVVWLVGADAFRELHHWYCWRELFALAHIVVAVRPGHALDALDPALEVEVAARWTDEPSAIRGSPHGLVMGLDLPLRYEAASSLRKRIAAGLPWANEVPPAVAAYIDVQHLYGSVEHAD